MKTAKSAFFIILGALARLVPRPPRLSILLYHSISESDDFFAVSPARLAEQIRTLKKRADIISFADAIAYLRGAPLRRDAVVLTFDDGYRDFAENAVPILTAERAPATVFVMGGDPDRGELGNEHPLMSSADAGLLEHSLITVGSHGATHRKLSKLSENEATREMCDSMESIARTFGSSPRFLAYPKGAWNTKVAVLAKEAGYEAACTVEQRAVVRSDSPWALPRIQIDSSTSPALFTAKLTPASDWYHALWKLAR